MCQHCSPENTIIGPLPERGEGPESSTDEPRLLLRHSLLNQLHLLTDVWGGGGGGGGGGESFDKDVSRFGKRHQCFTKYAFAYVYPREAVSKT